MSRSETCFLTNSLSAPLQIISICEMIVRKFSCFAAA
jgi:hypothetical protein